MPGTKMPAPYLPTLDLLQADGAVETWGEHLVKLNGDADLMLEGLRDYVFNISGKMDISEIVKEYFKANGYKIDSEEESDDEDDWDDDW